MKTIPIIDVTDLYHPHQDCGDNFDLVAPHALPEIDLRAVILDATQRFRLPVTENGFYSDRSGPRDPAENERAMLQALPELYKSFRT